ncbi:(2Fe-2S)-binding protein [Roseimarinus sediminis]|jgi:NAD(P)H-nitrite reductase large subunit|uniref:(2Fe-2S)-binding protein n=1 Tax=Roseimarinus sediminis TaxID=1610899 RepID=UPI003D2045B2
MIICRCNEVSKQEIVDFLKKHPHATPEEVKQHTSAATRCGRCAPLLERTVERIKAATKNDDQLTLPF